MIAGKGDILGWTVVATRANTVTTKSTAKALHLGRWAVVPRRAKIGQTARSRRVHVSRCQAVGRRPEREVDDNMRKSEWSCRERGL